MNQTSVILMKEKFASPFLADGDRAMLFRKSEVEPIIKSGDSVVFDFTGVDNMTDSFSNACFTELFSAHKDLVGNRIVFKSCSPLVKHFVLSAMAMADRKN
jgi:hypothetical protein